MNITKDFVDEEGASAENRKIMDGYMENVPADTEVEANITQGRRSSDTVSYKNMLMGFNGLANSYSNGDSEIWSDDTESENEDMQNLKRKNLILFAH